jgi:hypothetical protein
VEIIVSRTLKTLTLIAHSIRVILHSLTKIRKMIPIVSSLLFLSLPLLLFPVSQGTRKFHSLTIFLSFNLLIRWITISKKFLEMQLKSLTINQLILWTHMLLRNHEKLSKAKNNSQNILMASGQNIKQKCASIGN